MASNVGFCDTTAEKCPRHLKFSALCTINKVRCLEHLKVPCPWYDKSSLHSFQFLCHCCTLVFGVLTSGTGMTGFLTHSGLTSLSKDWSWASSSLPMSPDVSWAEPLSMMYCLLCTCDGMEHCCIAFGVLVMVQHTARFGLSAVLLKSYICCCFFTKRNRFLYDFAVGHWPADLLLTGVLVCLPPTIGPTLGTNFVVAGLCHPLWTGVASRALGLQQWTETKAI